MSINQIIFCQVFFRQIVRIVSLGSLLIVPGFHEHVSSLLAVGIGEVSLDRIVEIIAEPVGLIVAFAHASLLVLCRFWGLS
jgi:hypothetical protein